MRLTLATVVQQTVKKIDQTIWFLSKVLLQFRDSVYT